MHCERRFFPEFKFFAAGWTPRLSAIEHGIRINAVAPVPIWTLLQPSGGQSREKISDFGGHPL